MPIPELRPESLALFHRMSAEKADLAIDEMLTPSLARACHSMSDLGAVAECMSRPYTCLEAVFSHYAFARRGRDRNELSEIAVRALHQLCPEDQFGQFLSLDHAQALWESFVAVCRQRGRKPMEQLNVGVIAGMAELAQEIYQIDGVGSIAGWVVKGIRQTGRVEPQFLRMVDVRGIGPKITSLFLRDLVLIYGLEELLDHADRLYVQPIDKWVRQIAPYVIDEPNADDLADWILAGKIAKYARRAGVSGIRFNIGVTWFGMREVRAPEFFDSAVRQTIAQDIRSRNPNAELR